MNPVRRRRAGRRHPVVMMMTRWCRARPLAVPACSSWTSWGEGRCSFPPRTRPPPCSSSSRLNRPPPTSTLLTSPIRVKKCYPLQLLGVGRGRGFRSRPLLGWLCLQIFVSPKPVPAPGDIGSFLENILNCWRNAWNNLTPLYTYSFYFIFSLFSF